MKKWSIAVPILVLAIAIFLIFAIRGHWDSWTANAVLQKTNDAYVTGDQIPIQRSHQWYCAAGRRAGLSDGQSWAVNR